MAEIIIHAGMPKTGSTSVQHWLVANAERLRTDLGVHTLVATNRTRRNPTPKVELEPFESGTINSGKIVYAWMLRTFAPEVPLRFFAELGDRAAEFGKVLVTAEGMSEFIWRLDEEVLHGLDDLAREHAVKIAYYVRPQAAALEAMWREAGFTRPSSPSDWVMERLPRLHYLRTLAGVEAHAPHVELVMRPFRADLLDRGSIVDDFVRRFLGIDEECPPIHANPALPLRLVNVLRFAPDGLFRKGTADVYPRSALRRAAASLNLPVTPEIRRSRLILRRYCHDVFEDENQQLIRKLSWPTDSFVPPVTLSDPWDISELDALWTPRESAAELAALYDDLLDALRALDAGL